MIVLVKQIQDENDPERFDKLVAELNELIVAKSGRIKSTHEFPPKSTVIPR